MSATTHVASQNVAAKRDNTNPIAPPAAATTHANDAAYVAAYVSGAVMFGPKIKPGKKSANAASVTALSSRANGRDPGRIAKESNAGSSMIKYARTKTPAHPPGT